MPPVPPATYLCQKHREFRHTAALYCQLLSCDDTQSVAAVQQGFGFAPPATLELLLVLFAMLQAEKHLPRLHPQFAISIVAVAIAAELEVPVSFLERPKTHTLPHLQTKSV